MALAWLSRLAAGVSFFEDVAGSRHYGRRMGARTGSATLAYS